MTLLLNALLGIIPTLILGASIAAGVDDDAHHRRVFLLVYALWAFTLAGWNWLESSHVAWVVLWLAFAIIASVWLAATRSRRSARQ
ncbi:MAG: hypothetical protein M3Q69_13955 [Acidobacteriota bacterium]|nr:hypothetical protein [Acidobacteriota bacterium]